ncbi:MAG: hypothetical protein II180_06925 [Proteobacteria bacterium]|nr:hypothetical protein [Pseudomonadota bacterium]MBQ9818326.1 hypothetical protein [Pseudomonadota bacterium]
MLNSLNNNPGDGNLNRGVQAQEEPVIQEVYEAEPDDYNFQPQLREVDEVELRNLSAIREETTVDTRVYKVAALFLIAALVGGLVGYLCASGSASTADVNRRSSVAETIKRTVEAKLAEFDKLDKDFKSIENGNYNEASFSMLRGYVQKHTYMLDISSEVTSEVVLLAGDSRANPLEGLRTYSADTMLLTQLLSSHLNETLVDSEEISELQSKGGNASVTYAMQILPSAIYYLGTDAPRSQYANGVINIFSLKEEIDNDNELERVYEQLKTDQSWSQAQQIYRDYKPEGKKQAAELGEAVLPNHLMYRVVDRHGSESLLFADELILVDRSYLFGDKSANAWQRYKRRNEQIRALIDEARKASSTIISDLDKFIVKK